MMKTLNKFGIIAAILLWATLSIGISNSIKAQVKPNAPILQKTKPVSDSQIDISWEDCSDTEDRFVIFRSTNGKFFVKVAEVGKNVTSFSDKNLEKSTRYYYQVFACNKEGFTLSEMANEYTLTASASADTINSLEVFPNPISNEATIVIDVPVKTEMSLQICDLNRNTRISVFQNKMLDAGKNSFSVNTSILERGFYVVQAITGTGLSTLKIQVIR